MQMLKSLAEKGKSILGKPADQPKEDKPDIHLGEPGFLHKLLRRGGLESVFLFVTSRCNSKCRTCFYGKELNSKDDMTSEEILRISETAPRFDKLWLSGGEPVLRRDLADIVTAFHRNNGVKSLNFPTNGLARKQIEATVERLLANCPDLTIHLNFSLDGLAATHDAVRGVPGSFERTVSLMDAIADKYGDHPRLHRNVATVLTREALDEMIDLGSYLYEKGNYTTHIYEALRGEPLDPTIGRVSREELEDLHERIAPLYEGMADRIFNKFDPRARWFAKMYFLGVIRFMFGLQEENLDGPYPWGMACTAGKSTLVIDHNGWFRACELRPRVGRLQDYDFDLRAALASGALKQEIAAIGGGARANCWCTHTCWILASMQFSPTTLLFRIPWSYIKYRLQRRRSGAFTATESAR